MCCAINSSGLDFPSSSNLDAKVKAASDKTPLSELIDPLPSFRFPFHTADAFLTGIVVSLFSFWLFIYLSTQTESKT